MMNNMQDEFIATVSHELRTPLTSIRGFSQTLLNSWDKIDDENKKKFIKIIEDQSNRLIHLVENVLSVSKMHAGSEVLKKIDVNEAISKLIPLFTEQYKTRHFELELEKHLPPADHVEGQETLRAEFVFERTPEHPQCEHVEEDMFEIGMQEHVGDELVGMEIGRSQRQGAILHDRVADGQQRRGHVNQYIDDYQILDHRRGLKIAVHAF